MKWENNFANLVLQATTPDGASYAVIDLLPLGHGIGYMAHYAVPHRRSERPNWASLGEFRSREAAILRCEQHYTGESYTPAEAA
jgi:hypothetical protein